MYGKGKTLFLARARAEHAAVLANGLGMLVEQATGAYFVWWGAQPSAAAAFAALHKSG